MDTLNPKDHALALLDQLGDELGELRADVQQVEDVLSELREYVDPLVELLEAAQEFADAAAVAS